jgi:hypothetical protein
MQPQSYEFLQQLCDKRQARVDTTHWQTGDIFKRLVAQSVNKRLHRKRK